jgi:hypothetical protein
MNKILWLLVLACGLFASGYILGVKITHHDFLLEKCFIDRSRGGDVVCKVSSYCIKEID